MGNHWKSGCYLNSLWYQFLLQIVTRRLHVLFLGLVEKERKKKLQSVTRKESFKNFKIIIRKCVRFYKMRQYLLQSILGIIKCDQSLLQSTALSLWDWNTGLVSSVVSFTLWGEGASLALVGYPFSDGITIKNSYGVEFFLYQSA